MSSDWTSYYRLWNETDRRLDALAKQVREGVNIDEASNFARWLQFSGVVQILQPFAQTKPLPIKPAELQTKLEKLIAACGDWYAHHERSNNPRDAYVSRSKLDALEAQMARMAAKLEAISPTAEAVPLRVMGGSDAS